MEIKRVTSLFTERSALNGTAPTIQSLLQDAEICFSECNTALSQAGMSGLSYQFQAEAIEEMIQGDLFLQAYAATAHMQAFSYLDEPLYRDFKNNATETISQIILDEITTDNTFGMEEYYDVSDGSSGFVSEIRVKKELRMSDFLDYPDKVEDIETAVLKNVDTIGIFATMFRADYVTMAETGMDINRCVQMYLTNGEFNHEAYHPVQDILSGVLDVTVVKPLVEAIIGYDLITQERLDEIGRGFKLADGIIGAVTLGQGTAVLKGAGYGVKEILGTTAKTMALDALSDAAAGTVGYIGMEMGIPAEVNWILSVATGCTVSVRAGKYMLKKPELPEAIELTPEQLDEFIQESMESIRKKMPGSGSEGGVEAKPLEELKKMNGVSEDGTDVYPELDELEKFYEYIFEQQRNPCPEYEEYLDELRKLQTDPPIIFEGGSVPVVKTQKNVEMPLLPEGSQWERNVLNSFAGGKSTPVTYGGGTTLYRVGGKNGGFWSLDPPPATEYQWRVDFAIKQEFCNDASTLYKMTIPEGSSLAGLEGTVGTQGMGLYGGAHQVYIDYRAVPSDWIEISPTNWK